MVAHTRIVRNPIEGTVRKNVMSAAFGISRSTYAFALSCSRSLARFRFLGFERVPVASNRKALANDTSFDRVSSE